MGNNCNIPNCESYYKNDQKYECKCLQCESGYGLGGSCSKEGCGSCIKCGNNCISCKKCICTECSTGFSNNPKDPNNCIEGDYIDNISYKKYECDSTFIRTNYFFILVILLLMKLRH